MAATRLIAMHPRQGRSVAKSLGERTDYAKNPEKTEKGDLVTTYQCDPFTVDEEFISRQASGCTELTTRRWISSARTI